MGRAAGDRLYGGQSPKFFDSVREHGRTWFAYLLARECGEWDVDGLLEKMGAWQFERWYLLYSREPWGDERRDLAAGVGIMHQVASAGVEPRQPIEYMPYLRRQEKPTQGEDEMKATFEEICRAMEAAENRRKALTQPATEK